MASKDRNSSGDLPTFDKASSKGSDKGSDKGSSSSTSKSDPAAAAASAKDRQKSRRALADDVRRKQSRGERRKSFAIVGVCILIALGIVGAAAYKPITDWWQGRQFSGTALADIGEKAGVCNKITSKKATGNQEHVQEGTPVDYADAPPAFGQHYPVPAEMTRKVYSEGDRPPLEQLVHNLEHGYMILWYDDTVADDSDQMNEIRAIGDKFEGTTNFRDKFIAAPWTSDDGKAFPEGKHVVLTHWAAYDSRDDTKVPGQTTAEDQIGVWQYCGGVSGSAIETFMNDWPYTNSPEPDAQ